MSAREVTRDELIDFLMPLNSLMYDVAPVWADALLREYTITPKETQK